MRKIILALIMVGFIAGTQAQRRQIDSIKAILSKNLDDTTRMNSLLDLAHLYYLSNADSTIIIGQRAYELADQNKLPKKQARALNTMATAYATMGDYPKSTQLFYRSLRISEDLHDVYGIATIQNNLGDTYMRQQNYRSALDILLPANKMWNEHLLAHPKQDPRYRELAPILLLNIGECYLNLGRIDSADHYLQQAYRRSRSFDDLMCSIEHDFGDIEIARGHKENALRYLHAAIKLSTQIDFQQILSISYLSTAKLYHNNNQKDSAEYYAQKALDVARAGKYDPDVLNAANALHSYYNEDHNLALAYKYLRLATAIKDSMFSQERVKQLTSLDFEEKQRKQEIAAAQEKYRASVRMYALIAGLVVLLLLAVIFWRASKHRQKANELLQGQNQEIEKQKQSVETALSELKTTQAQLVQSAKMASLGELTAGIAHEIQNPLNFVNNFSEVNREMISELKGELKNGNVNDALAIADDIEQNQAKISHHGKRADFIVKGMLEHSRTSAGERQSTDINTLADEFLKLSYHGLRAKDKSFNSDLVTHFDTDLPKVNMVQQDIGRVLINLFGNAFYAVNQRAKTAVNGYKPKVEVSTIAQNGSILIRVKDNGTGIPEGIRDKIMQPFFTTKPAGEGTGLGLSLSYDIVVKGHGGKISVDSKEGEGSEFTIQLPVN